MGATRIAKWDNVKFWMILCVVVGHVLYRFEGQSEAADAIYFFLYTFHMPVFVFVAGMFSKSTVKNKQKEKVIEYIFIYIVMKFIEALGSFIATGRFSFHFLWESGPAWFALAMAIFLLVTMAINEMNPAYIFSMAILIGCVAGLDTHFGDHFASMRILVFFPVFLAGYYLSPQMVMLSDQKKWVKTVIRLISAMIMGIVFFMSFLIGDQRNNILILLKGKYEYADIGLGIEGVFVRFTVYCFWAIMIAAVMLLTSEKTRLYTWIGTRTMAVFIWHILFIDILIRTMDLRSMLLYSMPRFYIITAICLGIMITIISAYLPEFRVSDKLVVKEHRYQTPL